MNLQNVFKLNNGDRNTKLSDVILLLSLLHCIGHVENIDTVITATKFKRVFICWLNLTSRLVLKALPPCKCPLLLLSDTTWNWLKFAEAFFLLIISAFISLRGLFKLN